MTPTHKDGLSEENASRFLYDEEEEHLRFDLPAIILKIIGLATSLYLAMLAASPMFQLASNTGFVITAAVALTIAMAWASWFETLFYRRLIIVAVILVLLPIVIGMLLHQMNASIIPPAALPLGIWSICFSIGMSIYLWMKGLLYPRWDFFLPATTVLCIVAILQVI